MHPIDPYLEMLLREEVVSLREHELLLRAIRPLCVHFPNLSDKAIEDVRAEFSEPPRPLKYAIAEMEQGHWEGALRDGRPPIPGFDLEAQRSLFTLPKEERPNRVLFLDPEQRRPVPEVDVPYTLRQGEVFLLIIVRMFRRFYESLASGGPPWKLALDPWRGGFVLRWTGEHAARTREVRGDDYPVGFEVGEGGSVYAIRAPFARIPLLGVTTDEPGEATSRRAMCGVDLVEGKDGMLLRFGGGAETEPCDLRVVFEAGARLWTTSRTRPWHGRELPALAAVLVARTPSPPPFRLEEVELCDLK